MIMGLETKAWNDVYRLWKHEKVREPNDLFELLSYWRCTSRESPEAGWNRRVKPNQQGE